MMVDASKILMVHPTAELYGSDRVFLESVSGLLGAGHHVTVSLAATGPLEEELRLRGATVAVCPSPVLRKSMFRPRGFFEAARAAILGVRTGSRLIRQIGPSAIYVNTITIPLWNVLARLHRIPLIVHVHEGEASTGPLIRKALALPLFMADIVMANSEFSAGVVRGSFKILQLRTRVVYNAVPGPPRPDPVRAEPAAPVRLAYIGRLSPRKGVDVAIDALALLASRGVDAELELIGAVYPGYEWYEQQLREQVLRTGLAGKVGFHGFQPSIWALVADTDIVLVPSRADEPFGNTAVEAILANRPVIASETTGLIEATAGYAAATRVRPNDAAAIAAAVEAVLANWQGLAGRLSLDVRLARQRHGLQTYHECVVAIVGELIAPEASVPLIP